VQFALVETDVAGTAEGKLDVGRVGPRTHHQVVLEPALVGAVEDEVDAGVGVAVGDLAMMRDIAEPVIPVVPPEVVADAGQAFEGGGDVLTRAPTNWTRRVSPPATPQPPRCR
jgi:hypothetical protein